MSWLSPIGFLGLLGLLVLILIYIIKPNYLNKRISSTYIWRKSLKYKKQRIPISRIQNLLTFVCQVLILSTLGVLLAGPVVEAIQGEDADEAVIVVDASASMRIEDAGITRFERALELAKEKAKSTFERGSRVTLIVADDAPEYLFTRIGKDGMGDALLQMDALKESADESCIYAAADIGGAMALAEAVLESNAEAQVYLYTATEYTYDNGVHVVNVSQTDEWNAAILGTRAELDNDNHYKFTVRAACYQKTDFLTVYCRIHGVNGDPNQTVSLEKGEFFDPSAEEKEIVFSSDDISSGAIYSYDYVESYVSVKDSFAEDNAFFLYGGEKRVIRIQYASSSPNNFFESAVRSLRQNYRETWDVQFTVVRDSEPFATEGFDIYIFEHKMPDELPTDGAVLLVDPRSTPSGSELQLGSSFTVDSSSVLSPGVEHELTKYTSPERITIAKYVDVILSEGYEELMFYNGKPVMLLRDTPESKVLVWAFDLNYSNLIALPDFSMLIYNFFNHFVFETFVGNTFEVGDTIALTGRGEQLSVSGMKDYIFEDAQGELVPTVPGTYTVTQTTAEGDVLCEEQLFVKIPDSESDVSRRVELLPFAAPDAPREMTHEDLLLYFAIALVVLMFADWILEIKRNY